MPKQGHWWRPMSALGHWWSLQRRVVKFVCDVPTTIDQRLFAIGRTIQQDME